MSRRRAAVKREVHPDPKFGDAVVTNRGYPGRPRRTAWLGPGGRGSRAADPAAAIPITLARLKRSRRENPRSWL